MSAPIVPQRPARSHNPAMNSTESTAIPNIPPRPSRSRSANRRELAARSPLNDLPYQAPVEPPPIQTNGDEEGERAAPVRPSVASLPLIGQEGSEYASLDQVHQLKDNDENARPGTPGDTRLVADDLPLHAPKASVPSNSSQSGVKQIVGTRHDDQDMSLHRVHTRSRETRPPSSGLSRELTRSISRPGSTAQEEEDHGIPHIGLHVPMMAFAGDVQAPSPMLTAQSTGDSPRPGTQDARRRSLQFHGPPGSYGLHGHGLVPQDQFEKAWYKKHPEELVKEEMGSHGPSAALPRAEWALSSEQLNKLVTDSKEKGFGTSDSVISIPDETVGYQASEEYSSRMNSPTLKPVKSRPDSASYIESPLRQVATRDIPDPTNEEKTHIDPPPYRHDKTTGMGYDPPTADLGPNAGNTSEKGGYVIETGAGIPILASDEVKKRPGSSYMLPAVSPEALKHGDGEYFSENEEHLPAWQRRKGSANRVGRRASSRPSSARFHEMESTGTPLNEIEEYEPLFKDEDDKDFKRPMTAADKLKRPDLERQRFPSQDIWEDTPNSLQLETTVDGPQEPEDTARAVASGTDGSHFETPEQEAKRKGEITEAERPSFLQSHSEVFAKPKFNAGVQSEVVRPGLGQRFPSRDVWEDTPDSLILETTVDPEDERLKSPPTVGAVPAENNLAKGFAAADSSLAAAVETPVVPARPAAKTESAEPIVPPRPSAKTKEAPTIPNRPKPSVPPRPARGSSDEVDSGSSLKKSLSNSSATSLEGATSPPEAISAKTKPPVPSRPAQSNKFASIKQGFMNDLNSRLQLGPKAPPKPAAVEAEPEVQEEKAPLLDARKGRARGPARRSPAPAAAVASDSATSSATWGFSSPSSLWHISDHGLRVHDSAAKIPSIITAPSDLNEVPTASPLSTNTAGEKMQDVTEAPKTVAGELAHDEDANMDARAAEEEKVRAAELVEHEKARIGHEGDLPEPVSSAGEAGVVETTATATDEPIDASN